MRLLLKLSAAIAVMVALWYVGDRFVKSGGMATQVATTATGQKWGLLRPPFESSCDVPTQVVLLPDSLFEDAIEMASAKLCPDTMRFSVVEDRGTWVLQSDRIVLACGPLYAYVEAPAPCDRLYIEYNPIFACDHYSKFRELFGHLDPQEPLVRTCDQVRRRAGILE
ncbi:MAG: hypothetical protein Alpg2KO_25240 [Alphaproteobacteria bacterium]